MTSIKSNIDFISKIDDTFIKSFNLLYKNSLNLDQAISKLKNDYGINFVDYRENSYNNSINLLISNNDYIDFVFNFMCITFLMTKILQFEDDEKITDEINSIIMSLFNDIQKYKEYLESK